MKKQLMRSRKNSMLAGVCGGLADYFNIEVTVVRLLWVVSALFDGPGLFIYIICAIIIPKVPYDYDYMDDYDDENDYEGAYGQTRKVRSKNYLGIGLIGIGIYLAIKIFLPWINFGFSWPIALIGLGIILLRKNSD